MPLGGARVGVAGLLAAVIVSGAAAGAVFGAVTMALASPYIEAATLAEAQATGAGGAAFWADYAVYREWQGAGAMAASVVLGCAFAALYAAVYLAYGHRLPGGTAARAYMLAAAMWLALYAVPAIKYPPSLPGEGSAETLGARVGLHALMVAVSGGAAIALHRASLGSRWPRRAIYPAAWVLVVAAAAALLPAHPGADGASEGALGFRAASAAAVAAYWAALPAALVPLARRLGGWAPPLRGRG